MVNVDGETFLNASAAAQYLKVSRPTFYKEYVGVLQAFRIGRCRRKHYKLSELATLKQVEPIERVA